MKSLFIALLFICSLSASAKSYTFSDKAQIQTLFSKNGWLLNQFLSYKFTYYPLAKTVTKLEINTEQQYDGDISGDCLVTTFVYINGNSNPQPEPMVKKRGSCPKFRIR